jgi:hypothetical protein
MDLHQNSGKEAAFRRTYIVDMAKTEALYMLGEGEAGIKLAKRYL